MNRLAMIAGGALLLSSAVPAFADDPDSITFGQFFQQDSSQRLFRYDGTATGAEIYTTSSATSNDFGAIPILFLLSGDSILPAYVSALTGTQDAHLSVDFLSDSGTTGTDSARIQAFGNGTITITRDTPIGGLNNLLTVIFTNAELDASQDSGSFTFKSNASSTITYSSDFMNFGNLAGEDFSLSFSGASPKFSAVLGSAGVDTRFSGTGTFASTLGVPEISTWAMLFFGFGAVGAVMRAGRRQKDLFAA